MEEEFPLQSKISSCLCQNSAWCRAGSLRPSRLQGSKDLYSALVEDPGTRHVGKPRNGSGLPWFVYPQTQPTEKQPVGQGDPKGLLVSAVQVLRPLQRHPSFTPEYTEPRLSRRMASGRYLPHQPLVPNYTCGSG